MFDTELLIELVKTHPPLYNSALKEYRCKIICDELWKEIAGAMDKSVSQCRTVWTSLRSSYARHLQNVKRKEKANRKNIKQWYLADKMKFIQEHMQLTPYDRRLYFKPKNQNNDSINEDENSIPFSNYFEGANYKIDESLKSKELSDINVSATHKATLSNNIADSSIGLNETDITIDTRYNMKKCRLEQTSWRHPNDFTKLQTNQLSKRLKILPTEPILTIEEEIIKAREESTLIFFKSILFDIRKLSDKKLRLFKHNTLKKMNKYLDENENKEQFQKPS